MRRALRACLPSLSHFFGIQPWQVDDLTFGEIEQYLQALQQINTGG